MIRKLTIQDDTACQRLLAEKPAENLFIIGDIENFGYDQDFQTLWGDFDEQQELCAILLKYHNNYIAYASGNFNAEGFANVINRDFDFMQLSGIQSITEQILPYINHQLKKTRSLYYAKCDSKNKLGLNLETSLVKLASVKDVPRIIELHDKIPEFEQDASRESSMIKGIEGKSARIYYVQQGEQIISSASTTAENSMSAMIVGVCTHPDHKRKGYASTCMKQLCKDLLEEEKMLCLFYDNPEAGSIYKRLGFEDIGMWTMNIFDPVKQSVS
ncbi:GNAT family N-acetyltransferase [Halobacillus sp. A5]|uniref:GNAT family N-acetyltransferase n=1 Tax=Halobacillus sp. A5 TaxID=2880263 RepID=UPI0020A64546|nr:GNAT family N-acetyltransferase [Halobacillus sp. A5]MCP3028863.1 GNAT family N-acetyltransferase [Halobacillus sp. A5]